MAQGPGKVYVSDITIGPLPHQRGHWLDRLPAMDLDIEAMARQLETVALNPQPQPSPVADILTVRSPLPYAIRHAPPANFTTGAPLDVALSVPQELRLNAALLHYRRVDQAEDYQVVQLQPQQAGAYRASIPGSYTASSYPQQYFFELQLEGGHTRLYPGFGPERTEQPYFVVRAVSRLT